MKTIACDFDGVIHAYSRGWADGTIYDGPVPGAIAALDTLMATYAVYIHTTREPEQVMPWLEGHGFDVTIDDRCARCLGSRGRSCPSCEGYGLLLFWDWPGQLLVTNRKLPAIALIDDRAIRFESWGQALEDLAQHQGGRTAKPPPDRGQGHPDEASLKPRQNDILTVIRASINTRGYPPSIREICDAVGLASTSTVHFHLRNLEAAGFLRRHPGSPRALELLTSPTGPSCDCSAVRSIGERRG